MMPLRADQALRVVVRGKTYILRKQDIGPELPGDRDRREQAKRELERMCRLSPVKALGYSVPPVTPPGRNDA